jgi:two-component system CheB/CheR fusion protein
MRHLVDDLLDVARITSDRIELSKRIVDLCDVVRSGVESIRLAVRDRADEITVRMPREPLYVEGDPVRLEQVLTNLLNNAIRHSPRGRNVEVEVHGRHGEGEVLVRDYGDGIEPHLLSDIFDPFVQGAQSLARSRGGLGLGLTVVRSLIERHGGQVFATSEGLGRGSEFVIRLPLSRQQPRPEPPTNGHIPQIKSQRILVVEDNPDVRMTLVRLLERQGHEVFEAEDGSNGLEQILSLKPGLAFVDIGLPGIDGYTIAAQTRAALGDSIHLVAVTGYGQTEDRQRAHAHGFDSHLVKPVDFRALYDIIGKLPSQLTGKIN